MKKSFASKEIEIRFSRSGPIELYSMVLMQNILKTHAKIWQENTISAI